MPVTSALDDAGTFLATRLSGRVGLEEMLADMARTAGQVSRRLPFATLLILEPRTDLSELDGRALTGIRQTRREQFERLGLRRGAGAAVVPASLDAEMIMRLWNGLSDADPKFDLPFEPFRGVPPALAWLGVALEAGLGVVERTKARAR